MCGRPHGAGPFPIQMRQLETDPSPFRGHKWMVLLSGYVSNMIVFERDLNNLNEDDLKN